MEIKQKEFLNKLISYYDLREDRLKDVFDQSIDLVKCDDPELLMIVDRLYEARENQEKVFIAGDYDTDGIMATTILKDVLDHLEIENGYYIPNRYESGYGLSKKTCQQVYAKGYSLIITVDNGVKSFEAIEFCNSVGLELIITDHHTIDQDLDVVNILHPKLLGKEFDGMCGAGMAYLISQAIYDNDYHTVLAAIATIGDLMELFFYNRKLVRKGLKLLNEKQYPTIMALFDRPVSNINEKDIAFNIVPKINAIGRLKNVSNPNTLIKYFLLNDLKVIKKTSIEITKVNNLRKDRSKEMVSVLSNEVGNQDISLIVSEGYDEGLCGLVAGNLCNKNKKPTIVLVKKENSNEFVGSGRSVIGFNLYEKLNEVSCLFEKFGGHYMAVGLTIKGDKLKDLQDFLATVEFSFEVEVDKVIDISIEEANLSNMLVLDYLRPFGQGFKEPLFKISNFKVDSFSLIKDLYPKWIISNEKSLEAISFDASLAKKDISFLIGNLSINEYRKQKKVNLIVTDLK